MFPLSLALQMSACVYAARAYQMGFHALPNVKQTGGLVRSFIQYGRASFRSVLLVYSGGGRGVERCFAFASAKHTTIVNTARADTATRRRRRKY